MTSQPRFSQSVRIFIALPWGCPASIEQLTQLGEVGPAESAGNSLLGSELRNPLEGFLPQFRGVARDLDLARTLDVGDAAVERFDQLAQELNLFRRGVVLLRRGDVVF